jgi:hypothetical protein
MAEVKALEKEMKELGLDEELEPLLDSMKEYNEKILQTDEYIVKVTRFGYQSTSPRYKEAFELALTKVNDATANVLNKALETTKKTTKVKHSFNIEKFTGVAETSLFNKLVKLFKSIFSSASKTVDAEISNVDDANKMLKKLSQQI